MTVSLVTQFNNIVRIVRVERTLNGSNAWIEKLSIDAFDSFV